MLPVLIYCLIFDFHTDFIFTIIYGFTAIHSFLAISYNFMVTFEDIRIWPN